MSVGEDGPLPKGWRWARLGEVATLNPRRPTINRTDGEPTTFVPMPAVDERFGMISAPQVRPYREVKKGFTYFQRDDVLFAKITPCMQNGKHAVAQHLTDGLGFGSTEFHVLRPSEHVIASWIHRHLRRPSVLQAAQRAFTGAVGQQRVPPEFLRNLEIALPPLPEQRRIAALLDAAMKEQARARGAALAQLNELARTRDAYLSGIFAAQSGRWPTRSIASCVQEFRNGFGRRPVGEEQGPIVLRIADVSGGSVDLSSPRRIAMDADERRTYALTERDVLFIRVNGSLDLVGRCVTVPPSDEPLCYNDHLMRARVAADVVPAYLALIANFSDARSQLTAAAVTSAGQKTVNQQMLARVFVPVPATSEQEQLLADLSRVQQRIATAQAAATAQLAAIDALPGALLAAAFRGDL